MRYKIGDFYYLRKNHGVDFQRGDRFVIVDRIKESKTTFVRLQNINNAISGFISSNDLRKRPVKK